MGISPRMYPQWSSLNSDVIQKYMKILIIPVILVILVVVIYLSYKNDPSKLKLHYITLLITLVATFFGVYLAVYLNDRQKVADEKRHTQVLIKQTTNDINQIIDYCGHFKKNILSSVPNPGEWLDQNPIRESLILERLLSNDLFGKYCVIASTYLFRELTNVKPTLNRINNAKAPQEFRITALNFYILELTHIKDLLDNSLNLLDGCKSQKDFEELDKRWQEKKKVLPNLKDIGIKGLNK